MKNLFLGMMLIIMTLSTQAQEKKNKNAKHEITVKGNCEMCKKRIEKAAYGVPGVKSAVWNAEAQSLAVIVNEQKSTTREIEKAVAKAGHDTQNEKATAADYAKLHECCAYERN